MLNYFQILFHQFTRIFFPEVVWRISSSNSIYLTFDDGPTPEVTPQVLAILAQHRIKATFFCIGKNVASHPELFAEIIAQGHSLGNHTQHHLNGWKTSTTVYLENVDEASNYIPRKLFRPPYGKLRLGQLIALVKRHQVIMWDVITYDYDKNKSSDFCVSQVKRFARGGSIIVFHDSVKAKENILEALPKSIEYLKSKGFTFANLE